MIAVLAAVLLWGEASAGDNLIADTAFGEGNEIVLTFARPVEGDRFLNPDNYTVYEEPDPDIRLLIKEIILGRDGSEATLTFADPLNQGEAHIVTVAGLATEETALSFSVKRSYMGHLITILITAMLIKNFVFTKYLGLCVFMGTSKKKKTAKGMGVVFALVMVVSTAMSWFFYNIFMVPYNLTFLQIVVFIGLVALTVQAVDTVLRKVNPVLFSTFGIFLVLITTNCVIIAVPLMLAKEGYSFWESIMLAMGAGTGFALALYMMASVR